MSRGAKQEVSCCRKRHELSWWPGVAWLLRRTLLVHVQGDVSRVVHFHLYLWLSHWMSSLRLSFTIASPVRSFWKGRRCYVPSSNNCQDGAFFSSCYEPHIVRYSLRTYLCQYRSAPLFPGVESTYHPRRAYCQTITHRELSIPCFTQQDNPPSLWSPHFAQQSLVQACP
jgi:hypothetical protein